ncbi:MAG: sigma-54 dependent transcriptional regulator, partial [Chitinivibrionales bacterium]|nr:sigma-54 dependent transcriptional regulator [Chitinivibrionales bacterium]
QDSVHNADIRSILCSCLHQGQKNAKSIYLYLDSRSYKGAFTLEDLQIFRRLSSIMELLLRKSDALQEKENTIATLKNRIEEKQFENLVFISESFEQCVKTIMQGAALDVPILLIGETGTGKEVLARAIHRRSPRKEAPFIAVNCGALPANLIESQLFGHEKGSFTGAIATTRGYFEEASGGTLFLDEAGELPLDIQVKFLRALQEKEVVHVGASQPIKVDVRIIAATNVDLDRALSENRFRKDLYFRLSVLQVRVPPVRERGDDALVLANFFLKKYCESFGTKALELSRGAEKSILMYDWPGNVREIENKIQRAVITTHGEAITSESLGLNSTTDLKYRTLHEAREAIDREMIAHALKKAPGNLTNAGKILDIDRKSLRILLEKYGIPYKDID